MVARHAREQCMLDEFVPHAPSRCFMITFVCGFLCLFVGFVMVSQKRSIGILLHYNVFLMVAALAGRLVG